jgi:hypothetical protein
MTAFNIDVMTEHPDRIPAARRHLKNDHERRSL